jgi:hypothetical protein
MEMWDKWKVCWDLYRRGAESVLVTDQTILAVD